MNQPFHQGQIEVQEKAGVRDTAIQVGNSIKTNLPEVGQTFVSQQRMALAGSVDPEGRLWASMLTGEPGFTQALSEQQMLLDAKPVTGDALSLHQDDIGELGLLFIDPQTRRRMVFSGQATIDDQGRWLINGKRVFAQCPKYIQQRQFTEMDNSAKAAVFHQDTILSKAQQATLAQADTLFIATHHSQTGIHLSHRGGNPGFIQIENESTLYFPDYSGNTMFLTLGNISAKSNTGLLMVDFETGDLLQLSGKAYLEWDHAKLESFPGAQLLVRFEVERVNDIRGAHPMRWKFEAYSPFNPSTI